MSDSRNVTSMRVQVIWDIRDAVGLNRNEKLFLFTVESRGVYRRSKENSMAEMGMKIELWRKTRDSLLLQDLLLSKPVREQPTHYRVNADVLATYVPAREETDQDDESGWLTLADRESETVTRDGGVVKQTPSPRRSDSLRAGDQEPTMAEPTPKVNKKKTNKENREGEQEEDAPVPYGPGPSQGSLSSDASSLSLDSSNSIDALAAAPVAVAPGPSASLELIHSSSDESPSSSSDLDAFSTPRGGPAAGVRGGADRLPHPELEIQMRMRAIRKSHDNYKHWKDDQLRKYAITVLDAIGERKAQDQSEASSKSGSPTSECEDDEW